MGTWEYDTVIGEDSEPVKLREAWGIAVSPNGDVGVASRCGAEVCVYRDDGKYQLSLDTKQGSDPGMRSWPWNVCVNADGEWLVTDERRFVKVYSPNGVYTKRWAAVSPNNKPSNTENTRLCALAIDCNNQVLVGQVCDPVMYISRHRRDTSHIDSFNPKRAGGGAESTPPFDIFCYISAGCYFFALKLLDFFSSSLALNLRPFL